MHPHDIQLAGVHRRFGDTHALRGIDLHLPAGRITGLLGRNGSGKTTLLSLLSGLRRPSSGEVRIGGVDPFEDPLLARDTVLVTEGGGESDNARVRARLSLAEALRPSFDRGHAERLLDRFEVDVGRRVQALSRGQRAATAVAIAIASRCAVTLFDEAHLGMDAHNRYAFYDALLEDYAAHPRTVVISTHHVDEVTRLLEDVVVLHAGKVLLHDPVDDLTGRGLALTGPGSAVQTALDDVAPLRLDRLGATSHAVVYGHGVDAVRQRAAVAGVDANPIALQDLFVHLTTTARPEEVRTP